MSRIDIDQTEGRMDDIENAINDDKRQIFAFEISPGSTADYTEDVELVKRELRGTIYMNRQPTTINSNRGVSKGMVRADYNLLTDEDVSNISYLEMEGSRFEIKFISYIRGNYKRVKLKSIENGKRTKGYT